MKIKVKAPVRKTTAKPKYKKSTKMKKVFKKMGGTSQFEKNFADLLTKMGLEFVLHYRFGKREFDFCLPKYNLLIECHGCHFHCCPLHDAVAKYPYQKKSVKNDVHKELLVKASLDYTLFVVWEHEMSNPKNVTERLLSVIVSK